jgi:hypothetical protein
MSLEENFDTSPLIKQLEYDLETEFPGWLIARETSGRWAAVHPHWGALYGQSSTELRDRLRRYADGGDPR